MRPISVWTVAVAVAALVGVGWTAGCGSSGSNEDGGLQCGAGSTSCGAACANLASDNANCGSCGNACGAGQVCSKGACATTCGGGTTQCGATCNDLQSDPNNCGACGTKCAGGEVCSGGKCAASCASSETLCGASCVNTQTDNANCGGCSTLCGPGEACTSGACSLTCQPGLTLCAAPASDGGAPDAAADGATDASATDAATDAAPTLSYPACVDLQSDNQNCGGCGVVCGGGQTCQSGQCVNSCPGSDGGTLTRCEPDGGAPYCADTTSDAQNCGGCGIACTGATPLCIESTCSAPYVTTKFPATADTWSKGATGYYWMAGDSVSGTRATNLVTASTLSGTVTLSSNTLTACGTDTFDVKINGTTVGSFAFTNGMTSVPVSATFSAMTGPSYTIEYVVATTVNGGCGSVQFAPDVGTLTLSP